MLALLEKQVGTIIRDALLHKASLLALIFLVLRGRCPRRDLYN